MNCECVGKKSINYKNIGYIVIRKSVADKVQSSKYGNYRKYRNLSLKYFNRKCDTRNTQAKLNNERCLLKLSKQKSINRKNFIGNKDNSIKLKYKVHLECS